METIKEIQVKETHLATLEQLLKDNNWSLIVGEGINDGLYCNGFKSISVHNSYEGFVMSILYNQKLLKKVYDIEEIMSDALFVYFIQEYYENAV